MPTPQDIYRKEAEAAAGEVIPLPHVENSPSESLEQATHEVPATEQGLIEEPAHDAQQGALLLLDEADALFGKRGEVRDSHDRYAELSSGPLLEAEAADERQPLHHHPPK